MGKKIVAYDIFGTCFGFGNVIEALEREFGDEIKAAGTTAAHVMMSWFYQVQRDFTYLSICDKYTPIGQVFASTLNRALAMALDPAPEYPSVSRKTSFPEEKTQKILAELKQLHPRPGLADSFNTLWEAGYEIYAVSNGAAETTKGLLRNVQMHNRKDVFTDGQFDKYIISCDEVKMAKPSPEIYKLLLEKSGADASQSWFVSAHQWDNIAAKKAGFKTAYVTYEEINACEDIFGKPDITEDGLAKLAKSIVDQS